MRLLRASILLGLFCLPLPAPLIPQPNLAKRVESADTIVVARITGGTVTASGSSVSSDVVLRVDRVLKGSAVAGTTIAAHLEGRGYFANRNATQSAEPLYGIWFLTAAQYPYTILSRDGRFGELYFAPAILPEDAPRSNPGDTPAESVALELASALRWMGGTSGERLNPHSGSSGSADERRQAALALSRFRTLAEDFRTLSASTTLPFYRQFAKEKPAPLRAVGIAGLIAANDAEGVKLAAADWSELAQSADVGPLIASLMGYSNGMDPEAVRALGALALREHAEAGLRQSAVYALRAIHTREALPALVELLDDQDQRVRPYALSGLCLFVRNAPRITPEGVVSMAWLQSRQPAPFMNSETERYCLLGAAKASADLDDQVAFWKSWWRQHRAELAE